MSARTRATVRAGSAVLRHATAPETTGATNGRDDAGGSEGRQTQREIETTPNLLPPRLLEV